MRNLLFGLGLLMAPFFTSAQLVAKSLKASNGVFIGFYQYTPTNYSSSTSTRYPLIIFLHGIGERGNGTTELSRIAGPAIPGYIRNKGETMTFTWQGKTETFLVLAPQLSTSYGSWQDFYVDEMLKFAKANLRIDPNRIFLTGLSLGGGGVWHYASSSSTHASEFAGIVPVCGTCAMVNAANIANARLPVWTFHALNDGTVSPSCATGAVASINKYNPAVTPLITLYPDGSHGIWDRAYSKTYTYQNPTVYEWMLAQNKSLAANKKPVPKAGVDLSISASIGSVALNAGSSYDPDGSIVRTVWRKISGPSGGLISSVSSLSTTITSLTTAGTYKFELEVLDNRAEWAKDTISITVGSGGITTQPPAPASGTPTARAGSDITITLPTTSTTLDGGSSSTPSGSLTSFSWTKVSGPSQGSISSPASARTGIANLAQGTYYYRLQVTNSSGLKDDDTVKVTVNGTTTTTTGTPTARAGSDITKTLPTNSATLDGSYSSTPSGSLTSFSWTKVSGPTQGSISSPTSSRTGIANLAQGTYYYRLQVTNSSGLKDDDTVKVTVNGTTTTTSNKVPTARAGTDVTMTWPLNYTTLNGGWSSDPEKTALKFAWTKISGPSQYSLVNKSTNWSVCGLNNLAQGTYSFKLEVTDAGGLKDTDTVLVVVKGSSTTAAAASGTTMEVVVKDTVLVSPNPATSYIRIDFSSSQTGAITINITDVSGRILSTTSAQKGSNTYSQTFDISRFANGTYYVRVIAPDKKTFVAKFLKQ